MNRDRGYSTSTNNGVTTVRLTTFGTVHDSNFRLTIRISTDPNETVFVLSMVANITSI